MQNVRRTILGGILAMILIGVVGCGNATTPHPYQSSASQKSSAVANKTPTPVQFFIPQQVPPNTVLRTIKSSPSKIELDYAPVGYNSMVANTFWIQEVINGGVSTTSQFPIRLLLNIKGYYGTTPGKQAVSQRLLSFIIPSSLTNEAPILVSVRNLNGSTEFGKKEMINIANQVILNVKMNVGISR